MFAFSRLALVKLVDQNLLFDRPHPSSVTFEKSAYFKLHPDKVAAQINFLLLMVYGGPRFQDINLRWYPIKKGTENE